MSLRYLGKRLIDFVTIRNTVTNEQDTVPSSSVVYGISQKADKNETDIAAINANLANLSNDVVFMTTDDAYQQAVATYNQVTKKVRIHYVRKINVANNSIVGGIPSHKPNKMEYTTAIIINSDGSTQLGTFAVDVDGNLRMSALEVNVDHRGAFTLEYYTDN